MNSAFTAIEFDPKTIVGCIRELASLNPKVKLLYLIMAR